MPKTASRRSNCEVAITCLLNPKVCFKLRVYGNLRNETRTKRKPNMCETSNFPYEYLSIFISANCGRRHRNRKCECLSFQRLDCVLLRTTGNIFSDGELKLCPQSKKLLIVHSTNHFLLTNRECIINKQQSIRGFPCVCQYIVQLSLFVNLPLQPLYCRVSAVN